VCSKHQENQGKSHRRKPKRANAIIEGDGSEMEDLHKRRWQQALRQSALRHQALWHIPASSDQCAARVRSRTVLSQDRRQRCARSAANSPRPSGKALRHHKTQWQSIEAPQDPVAKHCGTTRPSGKALRHKTQWQSTAAQEARSQGTAFKHEAMALHSTKKPRHCIQASRHQNQISKNQIRGQARGEPVRERTVR
jgi:hypothetical protein